MKTVAASFVPPIALDPRVKTPLYRQLYDWFRGAILAGQMRPGQRVPATRTLAAELKISRIPVLNAYEQLLAEGYFEARVERARAWLDPSPTMHSIPRPEKRGLRGLLRNPLPSRLRGGCRGAELL